MYDHDKNTFSARGLRASALVLALAVTPLAAAGASETAASGMTAEQVIAKHVEARGGREAWSKIHSMKITGEFTAFSKISPFTLHRKREGGKVRYHIDHELDEKLVMVGYDGEQGWWDNHWFQEGAQPIAQEADLAVLERDIDFTTPFFDYEDRGFEVKLLGPSEVEGMATLALEVTRDDDSTETWHLDPDTYLEVARESPASDFGRPARQWTYYDDFREVGGVKMPFYVESQWYTRHRVMAIDRVETNVAIDDELFRMPLPPGMGPLRTLAGTFDVAVAARQMPGSPLDEYQRSGTVTSELGGGMLEERYENKGGTEIVRTLSYDRFRKRYQLTRINDSTALMDLQRGDFDEAGNLVLTNLETETPLEMFGMVIHERCTLKEIGEDGFTLERELTLDGGETWFTAETAVYTRSSPEESAEASESAE